MKQNNSQIKKLLTKLASGFEYTETSEEYIPDKETGDFVLSKRKITSHFVSPDLNAIKMLAELGADNQDYQNMTDDELISLKNQLVEKLIKGGEYEFKQNNNAKKV